jgi:hypothetical protein
MNMQEPFSELMRMGRIEGAERRLLNHLCNSGEEGKSIKEELSQRTELSTTSDTGSRTVATTGKVTVEFEEEDDEVMIEMEKAPRDRLPAQTLGGDEVSQQVDEEEAVKHHCISDEFDVGRSRGTVRKNGGDELGGHREGAGEEAEGGHLDWHDSAEEALGAIRRVLQEQTPGISYCHECGGWHELPRSYSFQTYGRRRRRQHR